MKLDKPVTGGPCWTELGTSDLAAAKRFYEGLFGWRAETDPRQEAGGYSIAHLGDAPVAALTPLYREGQPVAWNVAFAVPDADAAAAQVTEAGGTVLVGPMDVFDVGRFAVAVDPTGAGFQLWQARAFSGAGLLNAPGSLGWVELMTREPERAVDFYTTVFGWSVDAAERYTQWGIGGADFGGMVTMDDKFPHEVPAHWLPYFAVVDVDLTAADATEAGGTVLMEPTSVPDGPRIAVLRDPQGAMFGVYRAADER
ncbi:VOC family protein [Streptomyces viridochromogenes]|uniref:Putative Hydroxylase n=1 Tax=Streptomyces viridochromogenes Tue57 TaxID=1160705 RepID=L8P7L1_STRVR|nr:VOC family protein [Streptomyces viridochromogenes]ELS51277.1 putative Hydroxylase [Streptomyces viridochromogenes Tue57]